jgi:hypothetical protein
MSSFFLKILYFPANLWISKDNIDNFLMAEFQLRSLKKSDISEEIQLPAHRTWKPQA